MVCTSEDSLEYAHYRLWDLWFRYDDNIVSVPNHAQNPTTHIRTNTTACLSSSTSSTPSRTPPAPSPPPLSPVHCSALHFRCSASRCTPRWATAGAIRCLLVSLSSSVFPSPCISGTRARISALEALWRDEHDDSYQNLKQNKTHFAFPCSGVAVKLSSTMPFPKKRQRQHFFHDTISRRPRILLRLSYELLHARP